MIKLATLLVLSLFSTPLLAAEDGVTVLYDVSVSPQAASDEVIQMEGRYYIEKGHVRFETDVPHSPTGKTVIIATSKPKQAFLLFPTRKAYLDVSSQELAAATGKTAEKASAQKPFKATGKSRTIAGYSCQVMVRELADRNEEACTSTTLKNVLKDLQEVYPHSGSSAASIPQGLNGFPLEYNVRGKSGGVTHMTMRVKELRRMNLAANLFEVPKGYKKDKGFAMPDAAQMEKMKQQMQEMMKKQGAQPK